LRNYFRLLRMQQALDRLNQGRRNPGHHQRPGGRGGRRWRANCTPAPTGRSQRSTSWNYRESAARGNPWLPGTHRQPGARGRRRVRAVSHKHHPLDWQASDCWGPAKLWNESGIPERFQGSLNLPAALVSSLLSQCAALYRIAQRASRMPSLPAPPAFFPWKVAGGSGFALKTM
jgi:hypothetical protein